MKFFFIPVAVTKKHQEFVSLANERFQTMLSELGIETAIRCLIQVAV